MAISAAGPLAQAAAAGVVLLIIGGGWWTLATPVGLISALCLIDAVINLLIPLGRGTDAAKLYFGLGQIIRREHPTERAIREHKEVASNDARCEWPKFRLVHYLIPGPLGGYRIPLRDCGRAASHIIELICQGCLETETWAVCNSSCLRRAQVGSTPIEHSLTCVACLEIRAVRPLS